LEDILPLALEIRFLPPFYFSNHAANLFLFSINLTLFSTLKGSNFVNKSQKLKKMIQIFNRSIVLGTGFQTVVTPS
jgi:hypothetical protein